jgi:cell division protease FtsH
MEHHDPVHKITIISRGMMGGYTRSLPPEDRHYMTKSQFKALLASALGGHAAESCVFGEISTGAENDIEKATNIARKMVKEYGMSERLGTVALGHKEELVFLGREIGEQKNYSEKTAEAIDEEIRNLIDEAYAKAVSIINENREVLDRLAKALISYETLDGENLERVFRGEPPIEGGTPAETPSPTPEPSPRERPTIQPVPRLSPGAASSTTG